MTGIREADAEVLRHFRQLFRLTFEEVEPTGLSGGPWARIEAGAVDGRVGVVKRLIMFRRLLDCIDRELGAEAAAWAVKPLPHRKESPREIVLSGLGGANYLLHALVGEGE